MVRVTVLILLCSMTCLERSQASVFECYPNEMFRVENPGSYTSVFANNSVGICKTTWLEGYSHVSITGSGLGDDILISFSNLNPAIVGVIGGNEAENAIFSINCIQIPDGGVEKHVSILLETSVGKNMSKYHYISVSSHIYENLTSRVIATTVMVGMPLFWVIETEFVDFDLKPEECLAYAGKVISPTALRKVIIAEGCSRELQLVDSFQWYQPTNGSTVSTVLNAFRFYGSEYITMQCQSCSDSQRRRRMADNKDTPVDNSTADGLHWQKLTSTVKVISNVLQVVERLEPSSESTSIESECIWLILVWFVLKIF